MIEADGKVFEDIWEALEPNPVSAANMRIRANLMTATRKEVQSWGLSQTEAAKRLGISQPRLNDLMRGRITRFSLDALVKLIVEAGLTIDMTVKLAA
jgi:predicted XRE-type DNA-binding protein